MNDIEAIKARVERAKRGFLNPAEHKGASWQRSYAEDIPYLLGLLEQVKEAHKLYGYSEKEAMRLCAEVDGILGGDSNAAQG